MKYKLKDIALVQMGLSFRSRIEPDTDGNVAVIQMRDLTEDNKLDYRTLTTVNMNGIDERHLVKMQRFGFPLSRQNHYCRNHRPGTRSSGCCGPVVSHSGYKQKSTSRVSILVYQPVLISSISAQQGDRDDDDYDRQIGSRCFGNPSPQSGNTRANCRPRRFVKSRNKD